VTLPPGARDARAVGGGDINEAFRVVMADGGEAFVKTRDDAAPGEYAAEAAGLRWLAEPDALKRRACSPWTTAIWRCSGSSPAAWTPPASASSAALWR
jgi:fructosamine-3-kinase